MENINITYNKLIKEIYAKGYEYEDPNRKGVTRLQIPKYTLEHDLTASFPAISTKKLAFKAVVGELMWFLSGDTNIKYLLDNNIPIWNKDAYAYYLRKTVSNPALRFSMEEFIARIKSGTPWSYQDYQIGDLGRVYGAQWRDWRGQYDEYYNDYDQVDQIANLIAGLVNKPMSTEHIVTAWNPTDNVHSALPPCHFGFQILVQPLYNDPEFKYGFTLEWDQRSVDVFLGLPFNVASYALLAIIIGKAAHMKPLRLCGSLRNVHLYANSFEAVITQTSRDPEKYDPVKAPEWPLLDEMIRKHGHHLFGSGHDFIALSNDIENCTLPGYQSYPAIKVPMLERTK
jgi:thymidylate synthase